MEGHLINLDNDVRELRGIIDTRLSVVRANNLDNLNAEVNNRATQTTATDIRKRVMDCQEKIEVIDSKVTAIKGKTDKLWRAPTSGGGGKMGHNASITVSGYGYLRTLVCSSSNNAKIYLKIDGNVIFNWLNLVDVKGNLAGGGIRFNSQLFIKVQDYHGSSSTSPVFYAYTKGD